VRFSKTGVMLLMRVFVVMMFMVDDFGELLNGLRDDIE
jgi:hypothetical protein